MLLFDKEESRWRFVDDSDLSAAIASGRFAPPKDEKLYLKAADGGRHTATYEGAVEALRQGGWEVESEHERRRAYVEKEYGGLSGGLMTAVGGIASGMTLGGSDVALARLAPETAQELRFAREANPLSWGAGEAAGIIGPAIATLGESLVASGASAGAKAAAKAGARETAKRMLGISAGKAVAKNLARWSPAGMAARYGRAVAEGTAAATGRGVETLLPRVVGSMAEAVPATLGLSLGNAVLDEKPLTSEVLLANVGLSAAIAGGFPMLIAAASKPFSSLAPEVAKIATKVSGGGRLDDPLDVAIEHKISSWIIKKVAPASHFLSERPQEYVEALADPHVRRRAVQELSEAIEKHTRGVVDAVNIADEALDKFRQAWSKGVKAKLLASDFGEVNAVAAADEAVGLLGRIQQDLDDYITTAAKEGLDVGMKGEVKALNRELGAIIKRIHKQFAQNPSGVELAQGVFREVDELKRGLQRRIAAKAPHVRKAGRLEDLEAFELLSGHSARVGGKNVEGIERRLRGFLESTERWGEAGRKQAKVNSAYSKMLGRDDILRKHFVKVGDHDFLPQFRADDHKFRSLIGDSHHETSLRFDEVQSYYRNLNELADVFETNFDDVALQKAAAAAKNQAKVVDAALNEARKDISAIQTLSALDKVSGGVMSSAVTAGIVGYHLMGPAGAVGGFLLGGLARPGVLIRRLATMEKALNIFRRGVQSRIGAAVHGAYRASPLILPRLAAPISLATTSYRGEKRKNKTEPRYLSTKRIREELKEDPTAIVEKLGAHLEDIRELSPDVAMGISAAVGRAHAFLSQKAREIFGTGRSGTLIQKERVFAESQLRQWEHYVLAVEDPMGAIDNMFRGFMSPESAEALRVVYPALQSAVSDMILEELAKSEQPPPRATALQFSQFLGIPLEESLAPEFAQRMAARDMQTSMPQVSNPAGHAGTTNRPPPATKVSEKENVYYTHATTSQRLVG